MELITAECLWLECCNCGAVYRDVWANIYKEEPVCPHCKRTWYKNTDKYKAHGPTKECYRQGPVKEVSLGISSRWGRYQKLVAYLEELPVDEWVAHETAWRLSKAEKINRIFAARIAFTKTLERVLGWRGHPEYREVPWPNGTEEDLLWGEISIENNDTGQHTENQALALIDLEAVLDVWDSMANSGLTLWEALAVRRPGNDTTTKEYRFYKKVRSQIGRLRQRCLDI